MYVTYMKPYFIHILFASFNIYFNDLYVMKYICRHIFIYMYFKYISSAYGL